MKCTISMTQFAASLAECMGVEPPAQAAPAHPLLANLLEGNGLRQVDRVLIYNPDATGMWLYHKRPELFLPMLTHTQLAVPTRTVLPSVTPVCFGTMYTGVEPSVHGIQRYEKHVLEQESLFDCLAAAGKRCAIVAVRDSSMDILYSQAPVDHFIEEYDEQATERGCELLRAGEYDVVVVYNQEYDDVMHRTYPESNISLAAVGHYVEAFDALCEAAERGWKDKNVLVCWATDHGTHIGDSGNGCHGSDRDEDVNVLHFFGVL